MRHKSDLLGTFAHHPVAANLLMLIMLLAGYLPWTGSMCSSSPISSSISSACG